MRKNPTITANSNALPGPIDGIDALPNPIGVNQSLQADAAKMPEVIDMKPNNGGNPVVPDVNAFASGKDVRCYGSSPTSNPTPGKTGA